MDEKLSKDEMDALLNSPGGTADAGSAEGAGKMSVYNFRRPDRFPRAALQGLQLLHDRFATGLAASLSAYFRTVAEVRVTSTEQAIFSEFLNSLPDPTFLSAISLRPLKGMAVLEMGPDVAFPLIDRLLGGDGGHPDSERKMTDIERNVVRGVIHLLLTDLTEAWRPVTEIDFRIHSSEIRPQLLQVAAPTEVVLVVEFELKMGETKGTVHLSLPFSAIEPILSKFEQGVVVERKEDRSDLARVLRCVLQSPVKVSCELPPTMVTVNDLLSVSRGDIMRLDSKVDERVRINVGGIQAFEASLMEIDGNKSAGVTGRIAG